MPVQARTRFVRLLAVLGLTGALLLPGAAQPARAMEPVDPVLRVALLQDLDSMNPFQTALVVGFETFTLNYNLLVNFGANLEPVPGFAESWEQSPDGLTWTFRIRPDMKWSDGTPATAEDARWTLQLFLDAQAAEVPVGLGYLDPYVRNAAITAVEAPDPTTLVITTDRPNRQVLLLYIPIVPKHVWGHLTPETISEFPNNPPIVGSGPYQAVEWRTGEFVRFARNPHWTGPELAASEVVIRFFESGDTMVEALRAGEIDYASGVSPLHFEALHGVPDIVTVSGVGNGFNQLGFNTYPDPIPDGGASTTALRDRAFRDALAHAIDKQLLLDRVLLGHGVVGSVQVPPFQVAWHAPPAEPRPFDIELAKQKLEAAGYVLDAEGRRLDHEGRPINLRLVMPDTDENYPPIAEFITDWFGLLGIEVTSHVYDSATLIDLMLPPVADGPADFDMFIWGWVGDIDPNSLLHILTCEAIGTTSDSFYCNPRYDELFRLQNEAPTDEERKAYMTEMQQIIYADVPYIILNYEAVLVAYRTDRFTGWTNQPANGVPLFGYGSHGYWQLAAVEPAEQVPTPPPPGEVPEPAPGLDPTLMVAILVVILVVAGTVLALVFRRRRAASEE
jgi:peptide/nickel transport system substrate-binding protein